MAFGSNRNNQLSTKICAKDKPQNVGDQLQLDPWFLLFNIS